MSEKDYQIHCRACHQVFAAHKDYNDHNCFRENSTAYFKKFNDNQISTGDIVKSQETGRDKTEYEVLSEKVEIFEKRLNNAAIDNRISPSQNFEKERMRAFEILTKKVNDIETKLIECIELSKNMAEQQLKSAKRYTDLIDRFIDIQEKIDRNTNECDTHCAAIVNIEKKLGLT